MIHEFKLPKKEVYGLAKYIAPEDDIRYYLNGVLVEFDAEGIGYLVATNGHMLAVFRIEAGVENPPFPKSLSFIMPREMALLFDASMFRAADISYDDEAKTIRAKLLDYTIEFKAIEGKYPDWRKVISKVASGVPAQYQPRYLNKFSKLSGLIGDPGIILIGYNGDKGGLIAFPDHPDFIGYIMPWAYPFVRVAPTWATLPDAPVATESVTEPAN